MTKAEITRLVRNHRKATKLVAKVEGVEGVGFTLVQGTAIWFGFEGTVDGLNEIARRLGRTVRWEQQGTWSVDVAECAFPGGEVVYSR